VNRHDYRPTHGKEHGGLVEHPANGLFIAHVSGAHLRDVRVAWKGSPPEGAGPLVEQHHVENLRVSGLPIA
jgi:hypothetical protein